MSAAINRPQICQQIFNNTRSPARDFTASSLPGFDPNIVGSDALDFNPERARQLWTQANAISPWSGRYAIAYNADSGHQEWVDAVANSIKNVLGIDAVGAPQPTFAGFRTQITNRTIDTAFRAGWIGDYPSMIEFLARCTPPVRAPMTSDTPVTSSTPAWPPPRRLPTYGRPTSWSTSRNESFCTTCPPYRCGITSP